MKKIIDISHHHPVKSWGDLQKDVEFLITKATEGTSYVDSTLKSVIKECEKRKIPYWLYTFLRDDDELAQSEFLVKTCKPLIGKYFMGYVLDIESHNKESNCKKALDYIKKHSKKTMIYTMYAEHDKYKSLITNRGTSCAWWEARYGANNGKDTSAQYPCHKGVDLHQYTSNGKFSYLDGSIDVNKLSGDKPLSWFKTSAATKTTTKAKGTYTGTLPTLPKRGYFKVGDSGTNVKRLQLFLTWAGFSVGSCGADGIYGVATYSAVLKYKKAVGLTPNDGNFGKKSLAKAKTYKK